MVIIPGKGLINARIQKSSLRHAEPQTPRHVEISQLMVPPLLLVGIPCSCSSNNGSQWRPTYPMHLLLFSTLCGV